MRIALPIRIQIAVGESRVADHICTVVVSDAAMRQRISVRMADGLTEGGASREVTFAGRIAPRTLRVPVPSLHVEFGVLAVADRLPTGGQNLLDRRFYKGLVRCSGRKPVDASAQGLRGHN